MNCSHWSQLTLPGGGCTDMSHLIPTYQYSCCCCCCWCWWCVCVQRVSVTWEDHGMRRAINLPDSATVNHVSTEDNATGLSHSNCVLAATFVLVFRHTSTHTTFEGSLGITAQLAW